MSSINGNCNGNGALYPLTHPKTRQKAAEFVRARQTRKWNSSPITFEHLYRLFSNKDLTFTEIAQKVHLSEHSVQRLYDTYFLGIVSNDSGIDRLKAINRRRQEKILKELPVPDVPGLKKVEELALVQKLEVRPYLSPRGEGRLGTVSKRKLRINGVACMIHPMTSCPKPKANRTVRYGRLQLSRSNIESAEVHIFVFLCEGARCGPFIIPKEILLSKLLGEKDSTLFFIPATYSPHKRGEARLNPHSFSCAWNLIRYR